MTWMTEFLWYWLFRDPYDGHGWGLDDAVYLLLYGLSWYAAFFG